MADIPGCLESWPGEPGPGKCQSDVRTPDPKEEAAWGGKEGSLDNFLFPSVALMTDIYTWIFISRKPLKAQWFPAGHQALF